MKNADPVLYISGAHLAIVDSAILIARDGGTKRSEEKGHTPYISERKRFKVADTCEVCGEAYHDITRNTCMICTCGRSRSGCDAAVPRDQTPDSAVQWVM
jgi:hypothetical protein